MNWLQEFIMNFTRRRKFPARFLTHTTFPKLRGVPGMEFIDPSIRFYQYYNSNRWWVDMVFIYVLVWGRRGIRNLKELSVGLTGLKGLPAKLFFSMNYIHLSGGNEKVFIFSPTKKNANIFFLQLVDV